MHNHMNYEGVNVTTLSKDLANEMIERYRRLGTPIEVRHEGDSTTIIVFSNKIKEPTRKNKFGSRKHYR